MKNQSIPSYDGPAAKPIIIKIAETIINILTKGNKGGRI